MAFSISTARASGALYLGLGVLGGFSIAYLPVFIQVPGDTIATYQNAVDSEVLFRVSIASGLLHKVLLLGLAFLFSHLFGRHSKTLASSMIALVSVSVSIYFVVMLDLYASLPLLNQSVDRAASNASIFAQHISAYLTGLELVSIFWGLWLLPLGYLIIQTALVPRYIGVVLIAGGAGYLLNFFGPLLAPTVYVGGPLSIFIASISAAGELGLALWLLIMGTRSNITE
ncbi:MAG: DUF4386 domain-containing protein [Pseudomonadota bacterium]